MFGGRSMITSVAYFCTIGVLSAYALSRITDKPRVFDWANAVFFLPLTACNLVVGASWAAVISFTFGVIALVSLRGDFTDKEQDAHSLA